ncbi:MAG: nitrogen regulation protein NR(II) [Halioglobus sp.]
MEQDQNILDHLSTGIVALDSELHVTALNTSAQVLLETSEGRCTGLHARRLVLQPKEWLQNLEQVLTTSSPLARRSMPLTLLSGQEIHIDLMVSPITMSANRIGLLVELQSVDRLLKISRDENLITSQETTRAVIRGLAHEIKNPLAGVRGAAQLLARELPNEDLAEYTHVIIREADRLRDLVDRLLGPNQQLDQQPLNIHEILEHVRNLTVAESGNHAGITRDYDPSLPLLTGDRAQLIQAVLNIMRNALQAAENPDQCAITLRSRAQRQFTIGNKRHRLVCRVDIVDNGPGVPEDMVHTIFAPMVTGRADGTGLGLSIAQSIINRHGGLLECDSEPGQTRFTFYLPMEENNA